MAHLKQNSVLEDFRAWSGGFDPRECDRQQVEAYIESNLDPRATDAIELLRASQQNTTRRDNHAALYCRARVGEYRSLEDRLVGLRRFTRARGWTFIEFVDRDPASTEAWDRMWLALGAGLVDRFVMHINESGSGQPYYVEIYLQPPDDVEAARPDGRPPD